MGGTSDGALETVGSTVDVSAIPVGEEGTAVGVLVTEAVRLTLKAELEEKIKGMENELTKRQNLKLTQGVTEIVRTFTVSKAETDDLLREYRSQYERCLENLQQMEGVHRNIHMDCEELRRSFEELTRRVKERLDAVAEMLGNFRQVLLAAWQKERDSILSDLKGAAQRDQVLMAQNVEARRREVEVRLATFARDQHNKQNELSARVKEMETKQAQMLVQMTKYWNVFEAWMKERGLEPLPDEPQLLASQVPGASRTAGAPAPSAQGAAAAAPAALLGPSANPEAASVEEALRRLFQPQIGAAGLGGNFPRQQDSGVGAVTASPPSQQAVAGTVAQILKEMKEKSPQALQQLTTVLLAANQKSAGAGQVGANAGAAGFLGAPGPAGNNNTNNTNRGSQVAQQPGAGLGGSGSPSAPAANPAIFALAQMVAQNMQQQQQQQQQEEDAAWENPPQSTPTPGAP